MQEGIEKLYQSHRREMLALAVSITKCPNTAEDAVQTAFCKLWASSRELNGNKVPYAFAAIRNAAIDQKHRSISSGRRRANLEADPCQDPLAELIVGEDRQRAQELVRLLPMPQREVVILHVYADMTFRQIAEMLAIPLWTVTSRYRRALNHLRDVLSDREPSRPRLPR